MTENVNLGGTDKPIAAEPRAQADHLNENIELKPVTVNENIDLQPVTLNENIDLKPVAVDTCQTFKLAPLPETGVRQPYRHHVGYTMFGVEYMGVSYDGESKQLIDSPHRPQVVERFGHSVDHGGHHRPPASRRLRRRARHPGAGPRSRRVGAAVPLDVAGSPTALLLGGGETVKGEIWLQNNTGRRGQDRHRDAVGPGRRRRPDTGRSRCRRTRRSGRRLVQTTVDRLRDGAVHRPWDYTAQVDARYLDRHPDHSRDAHRPSNAQVAVLPEQPVFAGVVPGSTITTAAIIRNVGNVAVTVASVPDEPLFEVVAGQRLLGVDGGGIVHVQPATNLAPLALDLLKFTLAATPTIAPADWAKVGIDIAVPAGLSTGQHLRALPRIVNDRFNIDLLT